MVLAHQVTLRAWIVPRGSYGQHLQIEMTNSTLVTIWIWHHQSCKYLTQLMSQRGLYLGVVVDQLYVLHGPCHVAMGQDIPFTLDTRQQNKKHVAGTEAS